MSSASEQIKERLSIADVVGTYLTLEKAGVNMRARCPFHNEKSPSFFVSPSRDTFHCFGCNKGGDIFTFVEEIEGIGFKEALTILGERAGVDVRYNKDPNDSRKDILRSVLEKAAARYVSTLASHNAAKKYLADRGIKEETLQAFGVGYVPDQWDSLYNFLKTQNVSPKDMQDAGLILASKKHTGSYFDRFRNRIMFPLRDAGGRIVGFTGRLLPGAIGKDEDVDNAKYLNTPETLLFEKSKILYGLDRAKTAIRRERNVFIVEGQTDVLMAHQHGTENTIAVSGTAFSEDHIRTLKRFTDTLTFVLDGDKAGFQASGRSVALALSEGLFVRVVPMEEGSDPADCILKDPKEWEARISRPQSFIEYALGILLQGSTDSRDMEAHVIEHVYPFIGRMFNDIEKDHSLQKVAAILGVDADATREHYRKWREQVGVTANTPTSNEGTQAAKQIPQTHDRTRVLSQRLFGILLWQSQQEKPAVDHKHVKSRLTDMLGEEYITRFMDEGTNNKTHESLIFETEDIYSSLPSLANEVEQLFNSLGTQLLKDELSVATHALRLAESRHDALQVERYLKECQRITEQLQARTQSR